MTGAGSQRESAVETGTLGRGNGEKLPDCQGKTPGESGKQAAVSNK